MYRKIFAVTLLLTVNAGINYSVMAQELKDAVAYAINSGPDTQVLINQKRISDAALKEAYGGYSPNLNVQGAGGYSYIKATPQGATIPSTNFQDKTMQASVSLNQPIFDGFATRSAVLREMSNVKSKSAQLNAGIQQISLDVIKSYLDVLMYKEMVNYAKESLTAHNKIYAQIEKRSDSGIGKVVDLDQANGRISLARTNLMSAQANLIDAQASFTTIVGTAPIDMSLPQVDDNWLPETQESAISLGMEKHPALIAVDSDVNAAKAEYMGARAGFMPSIGVGATGSYALNAGGVYGDTYNAGVQLTVTYNLINGTTFATTKKIATKIMSEKEKRNKAKRQVEEAVRLSWNMFSTARAQLQYFEQHVDSSERVRNAYLKQFDVGQRTLLDLLDSESEYFRAKSAFLQAKYRELYGKYRLLSSIGKLSQALEIDLPVEASYKK